MAQTEIAGDAEPRKRGPGRPSLSNEELLDKALDLFLEKGFAGTSIDAICATAGMAKRTVYARYGDKESLFKAALTRAIEDWLVPVETLREQECPDLEATLLGIGELLIANVLSASGLRLLRLTNAESVSMPEIALENVRRGTEPTQAYLTDLFNRRFGGASGVYPEADQAAQAFLSIVVGGPASNAAWGMRMDREAVGTHMRFCVRLFLDGLRDLAGGGEPRQSRQDAVPEPGVDAPQLRELLRDAGDQLDAARERIDRLGRILG